MTFTAKQRDELARARATVAKLEADEEAAVGVASDALHVAGLRLMDPGVDFGSFEGWAMVCREHAKAIRDALEPFDDGERIKDGIADGVQPVVSGPNIGDVVRILWDGSSFYRAGTLARIARFDAEGYAWGDFRQMGNPSGTFDADDGVWCLGDVSNYVSYQ